MLWIDYFWERDTTVEEIEREDRELWIDYFWERDTTKEAIALTVA